MSKSKTSINHIHRYKRKDLSSDKTKPYVVFACTKPVCTHYIRVDIAEGKMCECNVCGEPMILDKETITRAKPRCQNCIVRKPRPQIMDIAEYMKDKKL